MKKIKIITVVGTRPEVIRLSAIIRSLNNASGVEHILVHTGQNHDYELNEIFFENFSIKQPDYFLNSAHSSNGPSQTIANILTKIDPIFESEKPDAVLILGDTNSCLCAISAKKRQIPIFHIEAGNRCFDQRVPEEANRKIVDHLSDINMTYSDIAREHLIREGLASDRIIKIGSPMYEVIHENIDQINSSTILTTMKLKQDNFFVVSAHREENISSDRNFSLLVDSLNNLADYFKLPIILTTHPRTRIKIKNTNTKLNSLVRQIKPLGFFDYANMQKNAKVVLSDSGTISEESSILNFSALNIREAHERPEAIEEMSVPMVGLSFERILQGIELVKNKNTIPVNDYVAPNVSYKVTGVILSYTDYINQNVWKKY